MYFWKSLSISTRNAFPEKKIAVFLRIESDFAILGDLICDGGVNFNLLKWKLMSSSLKVIIFKIYRHLKYFSSRTTGIISTKLGFIYLGVKGIQVYSRKRPCLFCNFDQACIHIGNVSQVCNLANIINNILH